MTVQLHTAEITRSARTPRALVRRPPTFVPLSDRDGRSLRTWVESHVDEIHLSLVATGAVLLRGFGLDDPDEFAAIAERIGGPVATAYEGPSPRGEVARGVRTASDVSSAVVVPEHAEISYEPTMPRYLFFWCRRPSPIGGETTLVDGRRVLDRLDRAEVAQLFEGPLRVRRRHAPPRRSLDPFELKRWDATFGTRDREAILHRLAALGQTARFERDGSLTIEHAMETVRVHPSTGERVFANHLLVFHASTPTAILESAIRRERDVRAAAIYPLARSYRGLSGFFGRTVATDVLDVHGAPIDDSVVAHVRSVVDECAHPHRWEAADLVVVDNHLALHGRRPYAGARDVVVAWSSERA